MYYPAYPGMPRHPADTVRNFQGSPYYRDPGVHASYTPPSTAHYHPNPQPRYHPGTPSMYGFPPPQFVSGYSRGPMMPPTGFPGRYPPPQSLYREEFSYSPSPHLTQPRRMEASPYQGMQQMMYPYHPGGGSMQPPPIVSRSLVPMARADAPYGAHAQYPHLARTHSAGGVAPSPADFPQHPMMFEQHKMGLSPKPSIASAQSYRSTPPEDEGDDMEVVPLRDANANIIGKISKNLFFESLKKDSTGQHQFALTEKAHSADIKMVGRDGNFATHRVYRDANSVSEQQEALPAYPYQQEMLPAGVPLQQALPYGKPELANGRGGSMYESPAGGFPGGGQSYHPQDAHAPPMNGGAMGANANLLKQYQPGPAMSNLGVPERMKGSMGHRAEEGDGGFLKDQGKQFYPGGSPHLAGSRSPHIPSAGEGVAQVKNMHPSEKYGAAEAGKFHANHPSQEDLKQQKQADFLSLKPAVDQLSKEDKLLLADFQAMLKDLPPNCAIVKKADGTLAYQPKSVPSSKASLNNPNQAYVGQVAKTTELPGVGNRKAVASVNHPQQAASLMHPSGGVNPRNPQGPPPQKSGNQAVRKSVEGGPPEAAFSGKSSAIPPSVRGSGETSSILNSPYATLTKVVHTAPPTSSEEKAMPPASHSAHAVALTKPKAAGKAVSSRPEVTTPSPKVVSPPPGGKTAAKVVSSTPAEAKGVMKKAPTVPKRAGPASSHGTTTPNGVAHDEKAVLPPKDMPDANHMTDKLNEENRIAVIKTVYRNDMTAREAHKMVKRVWRGLRIRMYMTGSDAPIYRELSIAKVTDDPPVIAVKNFLTPEECEHLISLTDSRLARSKTSKGKLTDSEAKYETGESSSRTSWSAHLKHNEDPTVTLIENRLSSISGLPINHLEPLMVLKYEPGQHFGLHHDGSFRVSTALLYLNSVTEGGETYFPTLGLMIKPMAGTLIYWRNLTEDGQVDNQVEHEAIPPISGDKWAVNCFFHVNRRR